MRFQNKSFSITIYLSRVIFGMEQELKKQNLMDERQKENVKKTVEIINSVKDVLAYDKKQKQPLFLKIRDSFLFQIVKKATTQKKEDTFLIGITGESASGKTTFVQNAIKALMGEKNKDLYTVVCCDDYYKDTSKELKEAGSYEALFATGFSFDTPLAFDLDLMVEHLQMLKRGESFKTPVYNFVTCERTLGDVKKPAKIILNEGLYVLNEGIRDIMDVKVYIFTPREVIEERWFKRAISRGKTGEAAKMQFKDVNTTAQTYIRPALQVSDVILNGLSEADYITDITYRICENIKKIVSIVDKFVEDNPDAAANLLRNWLNEDWG